MIKSTGSWTVLKRKVAWLRRFCQWVKSKDEVKKGKLTLEEINEAAELIVIMVQREAYPAEIKQLSQGKQVQASSPIVSLRPVLENGALRVGGRLQQSSCLSVNEKHPFILPKRHHVSTLIAQHCHNTLAHCGREQVVAESRKLFWIVSVRGLAKSLIRNCLKCRRLNARPMKQLMGTLPGTRLVSFQPPFTYSGVDYFGPLMVKWGRGQAKRWGCLFTCFTTRAVYLEVAPSLSTDDFLCVLKQFISRRGPPEEMRSDHGSNFVGAEKELSESIKQWNQEKIAKELQQRGIKWVFHPPTAAHMSGVWERLVGSAKKHLKALAGDRLLTDFGLRTLFAEVESILNNRPITPTSDDPNDMEAITPSHFLLQRKVNGLPPGIFVKQDNLLRKEWRKVQFLSNSFWQRWLREYLPSLQERTKCRQETRNLEVGDLVLLMEDTVPRGRWPLGRVCNVFPGQDGKVRSAVVKTATSELHRPITRLCLLEESVVTQ